MHRWAGCESAASTMEAVKDADIPDDAKKALEDAQKQLEEANGEK